MSTQAWVLRYVYVFAVILVPLVPAYVLFRVLKTSARVEGPYQGMTVKLGGAGALYFILFITLFLALKPWSGVGPDRETWNIEGWVSLDSLTSDAHYITVRITPPDKFLPKSASKKFTFNDAVLSEDGDISLFFESEGYLPERRCIVPDEAWDGSYEVDRGTRTVKLKEPVILRRRPEELDNYDPGPSDQFLKTSESGGGGSDSL